MVVEHTVTTRLCKVCGGKLGVGDCRYAHVTDTYVIMSRKEWEALVDELATLRNRELEGVSFP